MVAYMNIPCNRLDRAFEAHRQEYEQKALEVLRSGHFIMGPELSAFEREFAEYLGGGECVGLASGLDSLSLTFRLLGLGKGDEVIVQGNTFIAGVLGVTFCGASPVFAEPDDRFGLTAEEIARRITPRTRAVLVTHLYGLPTPLKDIAALCRARGLFLVEDCAQCHGAQTEGVMTGSVGDVGCFSFYPTKNLGAFGDGGAVFTRNASLAQQFRVYRNYGSEKKYHNCVAGVNSRLDELQAGLLRVRLTHLEELNNEKRALARRYSESIANPAVILPRAWPQTGPVWHQYVVRVERRDAFRAYLADRGIGTDIHYPIPPHLSQAYAYLGLGEGSLPKTEALCRTVVSLPIFNGMTPQEQDRVIGAINEWK